MQHRVLRRRLSVVDRAKLPDDAFTAQPSTIDRPRQNLRDIHTAGYQQLLFEPRLEEGLSPQQAQELVARNIAQIYVNANGGAPVLLLVSFDGELRRISDHDFGGD